MEEDIDIEEHDVMDNPALRNLFPDLSIVKNEILDYGIDESPPRELSNLKTKTVRADSTTDFKDSSIPKTIIERSPVVSSTQADIPDFKPNITTADVPAPITIDISSESNKTLNDELEDTKDPAFFGNRIILGSKKTPNEIEERNRAITKKYFEMEKCLNVKLILKDWGITLWKSKSYCSICKTLFPSISSFDEHNLQAHTNPVEIKSETPEPEATETVKSDNKLECHICGHSVIRRNYLIMHYKKKHPNRAMPADVKTKMFKDKPLNSLNKLVVTESVNKYITASLNNSVVEDSINKYIAAKAKSEVKITVTENPKRKSVVEKSPANAKLPCSHCSDTFATKELLISHLYEVLTQKHECSQCHDKFENKEMLDEHAATHIESKKESRISTTLQNYFICQICTCYFDSKTELNSHMSAYHIKCTSYMYTTDVFKAQCQFCDLRLDTTLDYNEHVIGIHRKEKYRKKKSGEGFNIEADNVSKFNSAVLKIEKDKNTPVPISILFICSVCKLHFVTFSSLGEHLTMCSSNLSRKYGVRCEKCGKKIINSNREIHEKQHLISDDFNIIIKDKLTLRRILHKCPKCGVHFTNNRFSLHFPACGVTPPDSTYCKVCDILVDDHFKCHTHSHQNFNMKPDEFIMIEYEVFDDNTQIKLKNMKRKIEGRNLITTSNTKDKKPKLDSCNLIKKENTPSDLDEFETDPDPFHDEFGGNSSDSDFEPDQSSKRKCRLKRSIAYASDDEDNKPKDLDTSNVNLKRRYCLYCKTFVTYPNSRHLEIHRLKECLKFKQPMLCCPECGLKMSKRYITKHRESHEDGYTLFDMQFYPLYGQEPINPPFLTTFEFCAMCDVYYSILKSHKNCNSNIERKKCDRCNMQFTDDAYKFHQMYHEYEDKNINLPLHSCKKQKLCTKDHKYTLYRCVKCDVMVTENGVEAHKAVKYDCVTVKDLYKKCPECDYSIVGRDYKEHTKLHDLDPDYVKDNIGIIDFGHKDKVKSLPYVSDNEEEKERFSDDGGTGKYILYQCRGCQCCLAHRFTVNRHGCNPVLARIPCKLCDYKFFSSTISTHYQKHKQYPDMTRDNIKIIRFGSLTARIKKRKIRCDLGMRKSYIPKKPRKIPDCLQIKLPSIESEINENEIHGEKLYQCFKCKLNFYNKNVVDTHECLKRIPFRCLTCKLTFDKTQYEKHIQFHTMKENYKRELINVTVFGIEPLLSVPDTPPSIDRVASCSKAVEITTCSKDKAVEITNEDIELETIYRCSCGLHYFSKTDILNHLKICGTLKIPKQNCAKCKLLFTPQVLFDHLVRHHGNKKSEFKYKIIDFSESEDKKDVLFKCKICDLLYVDKQEADKHVIVCEKNQKGKKCMYCELTFATAVMAEHLSRHHNKINFEAKDFDIISIEENETSLKEKQKSKIETEEVQKKINEKLSLQQLHKDGDVVGIMPSKNIDEFNYKVDLTSYKNILYKCKQCDIHFMTNRALKAHILEKNHKMTESTELCQICGYNFSLQALVRHTHIHHKIMEIEPDGFIITESYSRDVNESPLKTLKQNKNELFKCRECEIYFISEELIYSHVKSFHLVLKTTKLCKICGLSFSSSSYAKHNTLHHEKYNLKLEDIEIHDYPFKDEQGNEIEPKHPKPSTSRYNDEILRDIHLNKYSNKVYQCNKCDVNFMTKCALESHVYVQNHHFTTPIISCDECGLKFLDPSHIKHKNIHHDKMFLKLDGIVAVTEVNPMSSGKKTPPKEIKPHLYKCKECKIHYVTQDRCYRHISYNHEPIPKDNMVPCKICGLRFLKPSLRKHVWMHHEKNKYTLQEMVIEEYEPLKMSDKINCIRPKVEVYIAADRIICDENAHEVSSGEDNDENVSMDDVDMENSDTEENALGTSNTNIDTVNNETSELYSELDSNDKMRNPSENTDETQKSKDCEDSDINGISSTSKENRKDIEDKETKPILIFEEN